MHVGGAIGPRLCWSWWSSTLLLVAVADKLSQCAGAGAATSTKCNKVQQSPMAYGRLRMAERWMEIPTARRSY
jgi:hypothetical protein